MYRYVLVCTGTYRHIRFCPILYRCIGFQMSSSLKLKLLHSNLKFVVFKFSENSGLPVNGLGYPPASPPSRSADSEWSHSMRTRVLVIKIGLFHAPPWQLCLGIRLPTKGSLLLSPHRGLGWRLALRGAAGRLRGGLLGGLVLVTMP